LRRVLALCLIGLAGAGAPALAQSGLGGVLLQQRDLGRGWSVESPPPRRVAFVTCPRFDPVSNLRPSASAGTPTFARTPAGPFVSQSAYAYATAARGAAVWRRIARPELVQCLAASVASNRGAKVIHKGSLSLPGLSSAAVGYRVTGTLTGSGQTIDISLDMIVVGGGRDISALVFSSLEQPVARSLELRLARAVARRLGG
jgi:hypothetical protein